MICTTVSTSAATPRPRRPRLIVAGLVLAVAFAVVPVGRAQPPGDPVSQLRDLLRQEAGPDLAKRKKDMSDLVGNMDLEQLSRVLLLEEWRTLDNAVPRTDAERARRDDDAQIRAQAAEGFRKKAKEAMAAVKEAPTLAKAATADLIAETAAAGRKLDYLTSISRTPVGPRAPPGAAAPVLDIGQQLSELTPDLIELTKLNDPAAPQAAEQTRQAAARALGEIKPADPTQVVGALGDIVADRQNSLGLRIAAAESMDHLAQAAADDMQRSLGLDEAKKHQFVVTAAAVWDAVLDKGLAADQPAVVRRTCLHAFGRISTEMLDISVLPESNAPPVQEADPELIKEMKNAEKRDNRYYQDLAQVFAQFGNKSAALAAAVRDEDEGVRLTALSILVDLANARQRLQALATGATPPPRPGPPPTGPAPSEGKVLKPRAFRRPDAAVILAAADEPADKTAQAPDRTDSQQRSFKELTAAMQATLDALAERLHAPDVPTRRAAMDVLEVLGDAALPKVDAMTAALGDDDKFVRWAAARTLGQLARDETGGPRFSDDQANAAARGMAELLRDEDVGVRLAAATALTRFGPRAEPAAPVLTRMLNRSQTDAALRIIPTADTEPELVAGDPTVRVQAFRALEAIDGGATVQAMPEALTALGDPNVQVRQAAADMIGRVGPQAAPERRAELIEALGKALADPDGDVRRAVAGALMRLMPAKAK